MSHILNKEEVFDGHHEGMALLAVGAAKTWRWEPGWRVREMTVGWYARPRGGGGDTARNRLERGKIRSLILEKMELAASERF